MSKNAIVDETRLGELLQEAGVPPKDIARIQFLPDISDGIFSVYDITLQKQPDDLDPTAQTNVIVDVLARTLDMHDIEIVDSLLNLTETSTSMRIQLAPAGWQEDDDPEMTEDERRWMMLYYETIEPSKPWTVMRHMHVTPSKWQFCYDVEGEFETREAALLTAKNYADNHNEDLIGVFHEKKLQTMFVDGRRFDSPV